MIERPTNLKQYQARIEELKEILWRYYDHSIHEGIRPSDDLMDIVAYVAALSSCDLCTMRKGYFFK